MNVFNQNDSSQNTRRAQKEKTAKTVLAAAKDVFEETGFEHAGIRDIAAKAKVSPGTVIHHYGDKLNLLHSALYEDLENTLKKSFQNIQKGTLEEKLEKLTKDIYGYYQKRPRLSKVLLKESLFAAQPWDQKFSRQTGAVHEQIEKMCNEAKAKKEIRPEVDAAVFSVSYLSFFYFALIAWVQGAHPEPVKLVKTLLSQYIRPLK